MDTKSGNYKSEAHLQSQCNIWFKRTYPEQRRRLFLIYNNPPNKVVAGMLKSMGLEPGQSDMCYMPAAKVTYWLEFKLPGKKQTPDQLEFQQLVESQGDMYYVIDNFEKFQEIVINLNT